MAFKVERELPSGIKVAFEASSPLGIFKGCALLDDLFAETKCGCCGSEEIKFSKRDAENGCYLEMRCKKCGAQLSYGQNKEGGGIFAKRWDKEKGVLPNGGWHKWVKPGDADEETPRKQSSTPMKAPPPQDDFTF